MPTIKKNESRGYSQEWESSQVSKFDSFTLVDVKSLLRESSSEFNFLEIKDKYLNIKSRIEIISKNYGFWAELPQPQRNKINNAIDGIIEVMNYMQAFDPKQNSAWEYRNSIIQDFESRYSVFYEHVDIPLNSYLGKKAYSKELTSKYGQEAARELEEIRNSKAEIDKLRTVINNAASVAGDVASAAHSVSFMNQAVEHSKSARKWLTAVFIVMLASLILAIFVIIDIIKEFGHEKMDSTIESSLIRVALLAFLYIIIRFTTKNYSAHQHLYIVNKQRANVLQSIEAFRSSAISEEAKDTVLLAGIGAAFSQQESGFISTKEGAGSDDSNLIKVVENALKK